MSEAGQRLFNLALEITRAAQAAAHGTPDVRRPLCLCAGFRRNKECPKHREQPPKFYCLSCGERDLKTPYCTNQWCDYRHNTAQQTA